MKENFDPRPRSLMRDILLHYKDMVQDSPANREKNRIEDICDNAVLIPRDLMLKILVFYWSELEDYTGADRSLYDDDATVSQIFDELCDIFSPGHCEELFPGVFEAEEEQKKEPPARSASRS